MNEGYEYEDLYDEVCYCSAWDIEDYNRIMQYIINNKLDVHSTLQALVGPSGIQDAAESILMLVEFPYTTREENTPEMKQILKQIRKLPFYDNKKGWKYMTARIDDYLMEVFNQQFEWCAPFWEEDD